MHKIEAIILKTNNFEETSHILSVFSEEFGLVNLLTKNYATKIARSYSPFIKIETSVKSTQKELWKAGSIHITNSFGSLRTSLEKIELASLMAKVVLHLLPPHHPSAKIYTLFEEHLEALAQSRAPFAIATSFFLKFFFHEGILGAIATENEQETALFEQFFTRRVNELEGFKNSPELLQKTIMNALPQFYEHSLKLTRR